ncbi:MAG TPA: intradiol ring-cleavage dioxygenase [Acidimicrobiales bacterium]|jgi:protocatechuate 3,4-dioxygenase beta subunit|nr:intradiol ring-cleavage dioxygenase [Acidimicrobiales bacterium]
MTDAVDDRAPGSHSLSRRATLAALGGAAAGVAVSLGEVTGAGAARGAHGSRHASTCPSLTPEQIVGPFYVEYDLLRGDVTDRQKGVDLDLSIVVIDEVTCRPLLGAVLSIWQANAAGRYSDEASEGTTGTTYLRGAQVTGPGGRARFRTIFPGWYPGRCQHIHVKAIIKEAHDAHRFRGGRVVHVGQIFFPQQINDAVAKVPPYTSNRNAYVTNAQDQFYVSEHGARSMLDVTGSPRRGLRGSITFSVNTKANHGKG